MEGYENIANIANIARDPEVCTTMIPDPFACAETGCRYLDADTLENCIKRACPFTFQRRREEDQAERERKDARARGLNVGPR